MAMPKAANTPQVRGGKRGAAVLGAGMASSLILSIFLGDNLDGKGGVIGREGGYVDHPSDPGGKTMYGITEAVARANGYTGPMHLLPIELAVQIYIKQYADKPQFTAVAERSVPVAGKAIDTGVNAGTHRAATWFQESLNHFNRRGRDYLDVAEDGQIGAATMAAFDALIRKRGQKAACQLMIKAMDAKQAQHYMRLSGTNSRFEDFTVGWFDHRIGNIDWRLC